MSISVSSAVSEPTVTDHPQTVDQSMKPSRTSVAADVMSDDYEVPQPDSNWKSRATEDNVFVYESDG